MANLVRYLAGGRTPATSEERDGVPLSLDQWASFFNYNNLTYNAWPSTTLHHKQEDVNQSFLGYVQQIYKSNGVIFSCMEARRRLFSEARFQYQRMRSGRPGDLFGNTNLLPLEIPWKNGTTGDLLSRMIQDADLAGNFYAQRGPNRVLRRMRPDWVTIVLGSNIDDEHANWQLDAEVIGYLYHPGGPAARQKPTALLPEEVAHFAPIPDPEARFRGMSWLTPVIREIMGDNAATQHKLMFFENGATPNIAVSLSPDIEPEAFQQWIEIFEAEHEGVMNAYKTIVLGGGATFEVVGANMQQIDFKVTQGHGETRIAAAAGLPAILAGLSEGLEASTYSNYSQARRHFADAWLRPMWRYAAGSLEPIIKVPADARLWYDDRDIPFLKEDLKDEAEIQRTQAVAARELVNAGYEPASVIDYLMNNDLSRLKHTGLVSVQLMPPGTTPDGATNSNGKTPVSASTSTPGSKKSPGQLPKSTSKPKPA